MKTELKQLTDYQTFIVLDSGEDIPKGYQKIPYYVIFYIKLDLMNKKRLVTVGYWTVNDKEDVYSGGFRMETVRLDFFRRTVWAFMLCM
jgi:hypothetical protein